MEIINLTPHNIDILAEGETFTVPASGTIARVETREELTGTVPVGFVDMASGYTVPVADFGTAEVTVPVVRRTTGGVTGLPGPVPGTIYIVSGVVLDEIPSGTRPDVFAPDTGDTAVRDDRGHIVAVTRLRNA